jgi:hypothetical protein
MSNTTGSSTSSNIDSRTIEPNEDNENAPTVDANFTTPYQTHDPMAQSRPSALQRHTERLHNLREQEQDIAPQQDKIQAMIEALEIRHQTYMGVKGAHLINPRPVAAETPGPHRLMSKADRPEDLAYKQKQEAQQQAEQKQAEAQTTQADSAEKTLLSVFQSLTKVIGDNNKHLHSSDISEPTKFDGTDSHWDDWYL